MLGVLIFSACASGCLRGYAAKDFMGLEYKV